MKLRRLLGLYTLIYMAFGATTAHAYVDPGTGSLIIQGLIASVVAASAAIGLYWQNFKNFFRRGGSSKEDSKAEQQEESDT